MPIPDEEIKTETRKVISKTDGKTIIAEVTFPIGTSEEQWSQALIGYLATDIDPMPIPKSTLEEEVSELKVQFAIVKSDIEALKKP